MTEEKIDPKAKWRAKNREKCNQTAPEFKIESCEECPALDACMNADYFEDDGSWYVGCEIRENIERLVNAKR